MKITKELRNMSSSELKSKLVETRKELMKLNVQVKTGNAANPGQFRQMKKNVARILTILNSGEVQESK